MPLLGTRPRPRRGPRTHSETPGDAEALSRSHRHSIWLRIIAWLVRGAPTGKPKSGRTAGAWERRSRGGRRTPRISDMNRPPTHAERGLLHRLGHGGGCVDG